MAKHSKSLELSNDEIRALLVNGSRLLAAWAQNSLDCSKKTILEGIDRLRVIAEQLDEEG